MIARTYHCVNRMLYSCMGLGVLGVCAYTLSRSQGDFWSSYQNITALAAIVITLLWCSYFALLRFEINEQGLSRCLLSRRHIGWGEAANIQVTEFDQYGQAQKKVLIEGKDGSRIELSSDLLSLDNMEELIADLRAEGHIK